jgi:hypothetical protein
MKEVYYAGLDVHKDTVQLVVLGSRGKEPVSSKCVPNNGTKIVKELAKYQGNGKTARAAYEAGRLGYTRVIPPNKVFHDGDGAVKTDYCDAVDIAWMLRRNAGSITRASGIGK